MGESRVMVRGAAVPPGRFQAVTTLWTALACRIHFNSDKRVKWHRFLMPETFPPGTVPRSDRTMVDTRIRLALSRVSESSGIALWLSLFRNDLRTVLAVKGPLRRAYRRALDRSGPFRRRHFH